MVPFFVAPGFSTLCAAFSSTIRGHVEKEIVRFDLRAPRAAQRVSQTISVRVSIARDFSSRIGQALSEKNQRDEISSLQLISSFVRCAIRLNHPAGGVSIPIAKRSADPKIHMFDQRRRRPLERGRSARRSRDDPAPLSNFMK